MLSIVGGLSLSACAHTRPMSMRGDHEVEGRIVDVRSEQMLLNKGMRYRSPLSPFQGPVISRAPRCQVA